MDNSEIDILISKFLDNEATEEEESFLLQWIQVPENRLYLEEYVRTEIWIKYSLNASQVEKQLSTLSIYPERNRRRRFNPLALAALFVLFLGLGSFIYWSLRPTSIQTWDTNTLTLEINDNGISKFYSLESDLNLPTTGGLMTIEKDSLLRYYFSDAPFNESANTVYHTVHVPYGKTFKVQLEDGSLVHLNAGSKLTYPHSFNGFHLREVSLIGEAYFNITSDSIPFQVFTDGISTKVLGTSFNVSAYKDEVLREVVLVEGKVEVSANQNRAPSKVSKTIIPNQRATFLNEDKDLSVSNVDPTDYIAWTEGELVFSNEGIDQIIKKLERKFNVDIDNNYEKLSTQRFNGKFRDENVTAILETIRAHTNFSYSLNGNTLVIKEP
ncbi:FecR domain-containing protein [Flagellimonas meridianipacifica]|uniref:FecR protein n=1 Tax=Flagellimonas meridianipacifica TaxID=1080225 RepID=A0A2T0MBQ9_9FLAO|nr:FecR domain-containing protein [Allomuricauda pacifica]PRX54930.1 FecR protein [Allomuricauda pacifica]